MGNLSILYHLPPCQPYLSENPYIPIFSGVFCTTKGRTLLILGEPGSGKTITLLEIAQELIERTEQDSQLPIPVVFNLSSWNREKWTIKDWLVHEFETGIYKIPAKLSRAWIQNQQLLLLLDGLDEVRPTVRKSCVQAINQFSQAYGQTEIIVCSRAKAYEALSHRLRFQTALLLQPLTSEQIQGFLDQVGEKAIGIKAALESDSKFQKLVQTPLILSVMVLVYEGVSEIDFSSMSLEDSQHHLWGRYIDRMLGRKYKACSYSKAQILRWLQFLAQEMIAQSQTVFLIEGLNPRWLKTRWQRWVYPILTVIASGSFIACTYGIFFGIIDARLSINMIIGLISGMLWGGLFSLSPTISLFTKVGWNWSFDKFWKAVVQGFVGGLTIGSLLWGIGNLINLFSLSLIKALPLILTGSAVVACVGTISTGLISSDIRDPNSETRNSYLTTPNQGIRQSASRAFWLTLFSLFTVIFPLNLFYNSFFPYSFLLGCITLYSGGMGVIQHFVIRSILWMTDEGPQNYTDFLNHATDCLFLNKSGGGYQFIHDLLRQEITYFKISEHIEKDRTSNLSKKILFFTASLTLFSLSLILPLSLDTWKISSFEVLDRVPTPENIFEVGDHLLLDRLFVHFTHLDCGDIVYFKVTEEMIENQYKKQAYIGQIFATVKDDDICINQNNPNLSYLSDSIARLQNTNKSENQSAHDYFIAVQNHQDGKQFSVYRVPSKRIVDHLFLRFWPVDRVRFL